MFRKPRGGTISGLALCGAGQGTAVHELLTTVPGPCASKDGERYDLVLHTNGDPSQEIWLAFMPFAFQDNRDSDEK